MQISKTKLTIFTAIFIPTVLIGSELLGQGIDVEFAYKLIPNTIWRPLESVGFIIATLTINNFYLGVYICSFLLSGALAYYFKNSFYKKYYIYLLYIIGISFSWPLILLANNALRQGVSIALSLVIIGILKNKEEGISRKILIILAFPVLIFSHKYGQLSSIIIFVSLLIPKKFNSSLVPIITSFFITTLIIIYAHDQITEYNAPGAGLDAQYFLIPFLIVYYVFYIFYFRKVECYNKVSLTLTISFLILSIFGYQNSAISERFLFFPVVNTFLTLPDFQKIIKPRWFFYCFSTSIVFFYMCMSLYFVGFKYYN